MGYRFTLESANIVANLTFGKVISCYRDIFSSIENYEGFIAFLEQFRRNLYSDDERLYFNSIDRLSEMLCYRRTQIYRGIEDNNLPYNSDILDELKSLSKLFERCTIKSLLLPPMRKYKSKDFITSPILIDKLYELHCSDSCLILQPQEQPINTSVFNAFPNFDVALRQADKWPAVLFWDGIEDYTFIPVCDESELLNLYKIVKYEHHPIGELRRIAEQKKEKSHYIFQLSDLHYGAKNVDISERRLKSLIKKQLSKLDVDDSVTFVITGDAINSPKRSMKASFCNFKEYIQEHSGQKPICVLGNHDINIHGIATFHGRQHIASCVSGYPKIKILEESKVILLLFNSNTNGDLAQGEIGIEQMLEMGNKLDDVENVEDYLLIAVMHHHLLPVPKPNHYDKRWYEKIIPNNFKDMSLKLLDADLFMDWLCKRNVKIVLHGHKHIPFMAESNGVTVIGCGSSTGHVVHREKGKTYLSYNILKINDKTVTCTQFAEEVYGAGADNIRTQIIGT